MNKPQKDNRLFDNNFLEGLSKTNAYLVIIVYMSISLGITSYGVVKLELSIIIQAIIFISGLIFFSLTEYVIHRYIFHSHELKTNRNFSNRLHQIHHDRPRDKKRLALPLLVGLVFASVVYFLFWLMLRIYAPFFFSGFILGYALYLLVHYLIHTRRQPNNILRALWINHHSHHYEDHKRAFGVTSPLWDIIFKTMPEKFK